MLGLDPFCTRSSLRLLLADRPSYNPLFRTEYANCVTDDLNSGESLTELSSIWWLLSHLFFSIAKHESFFLSVCVCAASKLRMSKYLTNVISKNFIIYLPDGLCYITFSFSLHSCGLSWSSPSVAIAKSDLLQKMRSDTINMTKDRLHWAFLHV